MVIKFDENFGKKLIYFQIIYNLIIKFFISVLHLPTFLNYITDVVTLLLLIVIYKKFQKTFYKIHYKSSLFVIFLFSISLLLGIIFNLVPLQLLLWAIRNTYRFFVFFIACVVCLDSKDVERILKILFDFQFINIIACMFEFFVLGCEQDNLGGIFGIESGCNGGLNLYFCILTTVTLVEYVYKKTNITSVIYILLSTIVISAMAELKFFYVELIFIIILIFLLTKPNLKKVLLVVSFIFILSIGMNIFKVMYPLHYDVLTNKDMFLSYFSSAGTG